MTYVIQALVGIAAALLTMVITPSLQRYFWTRQRHAERQLTIIDELRSLAAELQFLVWWKPEDISARQERLYTALYRAGTSVDSLFSEAALDSFLAVSKHMEAIIRLTAPNSSQPRSQLHEQLMTALLDALIVLYRDVGIPPPPPRQWVREHAWQPIRTHVWDHPWQYWCESCWPTLQRWGTQARTRIRR